MNDVDMPSFRTLYHELKEYTYRGSRAYEDVLRPWLPNALKAMSVLSQFGDPAMRAWREGDPEHPDPCNGGDRNYLGSLERLYALSRVNDLLLISFEPEPSQPVRVYGLSPVAGVTADKYLTWWTGLGMAQIPESQPFHPFYHEIVTVEQSDAADEPIQVIDTVWPGFMLGSMLFSRAGVRVRGGRNHLVKEVAETSCLYWTYARKNRPTDDLSHGWGHNSQWATDFRRDYMTDEAYYYHVDGYKPLFDADGKLDQDLRPDELTERGALEIMTHRCIITAGAGPDFETYPYDNSYVERRVS